ncbi:MAG: Fur family transcriptional regulator [Thermoleophilaceae bacterium]
MTHAPHSPRRAFRDLADVAEALRAAGGRLSAPRRMVLEALFRADGPVSAEYIAEGRDGQTPRLEPTSVYRTLEQLESLGAVRHVHIGHGPGLYALNTDGEQEYIACERCDRVTRVDPARLDPVREQVRAAFGYHVRFSHFPMLGLCSHCARDAPGTGRADHGEHEHAHEHAHGDRVHAHPHRHGASAEHHHSH